MLDDDEVEVEEHQNSNKWIDCTEKIKHSLLVELFSFLIRIKITLFTWFS